VKEGTILPHIWGGVSDVDKPLQLLFIKTKGVGYFGLPVQQSGRFLEFLL